MTSYLDMRSSHKSQILARSPRYTKALPDTDRIKIWISQKILREIASCAEDACNVLSEVVYWQEHANFLELLEKIKDLSLQLEQLCPQRNFKETAGAAITWESALSAIQNTTFHTSDIISSAKENEELSSEASKQDVESGTPETRHLDYDKIWVGHILRNPLLDQSSGATSKSTSARMNESMAGPPQICTATLIRSQRPRQIQGPGYAAADALVTEVHNPEKLLQLDYCQKF
ncbi:hypothetical protein S40288_11653 [Stachybotrys chartarum IBT 40288]|nr:hypothetical protein S40288_11653 [Stachybotrys chartarum IBT 40288]